MNIQFEQNNYEITSGLLYAVEQIAKGFKEGVQNEKTHKWTVATYISFCNFEEISGLFASIRLPIIGDFHDFLIKNATLNDLEFLHKLFKTGEMKMYPEKNSCKFFLNDVISFGFMLTLKNFIHSILENYNHYEEEYPEFDLFDDYSEEEKKIIAEVDAKVDAAEKEYYAELVKLTNCSDIVERLYECL